MVGFCYFIQKHQHVITAWILLQSGLFFSFCLCRYLSLVEGAELYAVVRDSTKAVVSLPPVTNSERSKVRLHKNNSFKNSKHKQDTMKWEVHYSLFSFKWFQSLILYISVHDRSRQRSSMCSWKSHHQLIWPPASRLWTIWYARCLKLDYALKLKGKLQQVLWHVHHLREN